MNPTHLTLRDLRIGEPAIVAGYAPDSKPIRERLLSMGLTRGTALTIVRTAPAGDPIEISIRGFSLTLRRAEAAAIHVHRSPTAERA